MNEPGANEDEPQEGAMKIAFFGAFKSFDYFKIGGTASFTRRLATFLLSAGPVDINKFLTVMLDQSYQDIVKLLETFKLTQHLKTYHSFGKA
jgi:hypothetical protein